MARMIRKQKGILGESIYTDSHFRTVGTSRKFGNSEQLLLTGTANTSARSGRDSSVKMYTWTNNGA